MHFVFIVGSYYPYYSAVGKCVGNVADVLSQRHKVTIICEKSYFNQLDVDVCNNQNILRVITHEKIVREKLKENIKKAVGGKKKIHILRLNTYKLLQTSKLVFSKVSIKKELVRSYLSGLLDIDEKIDVIIPASMPFESVVAAHRYKKIYDKEVILMPYLFDQFVENESLHRLKVNKWIKRKNHKKLEKNIISDSKSVLIMKQLSKYFLMNYPSYSSLLQEVEHPLLVNNSKPNLVIDNNNSILLTYAGSFYKNIRDPEYMLRIFDLSLNKIKGVLNLYTLGNCSTIIRDYSLKNARIKDNGSLPSNLVPDVLRKANFLIAVGNSVSNQVPSKIFEYLSVGKPIIYFYTMDEDLNVEVLRKYPNGLCIKQNDNNIEENISKLVHFCKMNKGNIIPYDDISKIYPDALPEYTAKLIERIVFKNL